AAVEALIPVEAGIPATTLAEFEQNGLLQWVDLENNYIQYLRQRFDFLKLNNAPAKLAYDAMYGAGQNVIRKVLPSSVLLHCDHNPSFKGTAPEPIHKNLKEFSQLLANTPELKIGLATDGD